MASSFASSAPLTPRSDDGDGGARLGRPRARRPRGRRPSRESATASALRVAAVASARVGADDAAEKCRDAVRRREAPVEAVPRGDEDEVVAHATSRSSRRSRGTRGAARPPGRPLDVAERARNTTGSKKRGDFRRALAARVRCRAQARANRLARTSSRASRRGGARRPRIETVAVDTRRHAHLGADGAAGALAREVDRVLDGLDRRVSARSRRAPGVAGRRRRRAASRVGAPARAPSRAGARRPAPSPGFVASISP